MRRTAAIDTARLRLRPYRESDLDALYHLWTEPDVRRYLWDDQVIGYAVAAETMRASIACTAAHGFGHWAACLAGHPAVIGCCGFRFLDDTPDVELLYALAPAQWGRGLATEAARAMLRWGFAEHRFARVLAITDVENRASVAVLQRLAMQPESSALHDGPARRRYVMTREAFQPGAETLLVRYTEAT